MSLESILMIFIISLLLAPIRSFVFKNFRTLISVLVGTFIGLMIISEAGSLAGIGGLPSIMVAIGLILVAIRYVRQFWDDVFPPRRQQRDKHDQET